MAAAGRQLSAAGKHSPKQSDIPAYVDSGAENPRGIHAMRALEDQRNFSIDSLIAAAYSSAMPEFEIQIPLLRKAYADLPVTDPHKAQLAEATLLLQRWDYRWSNKSVPMSIAMFYGERLLEHARPAAVAANVYLYRYLKDSVTAEQRLAFLAAAVAKLQANFGSSQTPSGQISRFQRNKGDIVQTFDDAKPSIPVMFGSAHWGSLAAFESRAHPQIKRWYGTSGNSFVCLRKRAKRKVVAVVEFGEHIKAKAIAACGLHSIAGSSHFSD